MKFKYLGGTVFKISGKYIDLLTDIDRAKVDKVSLSGQNADLVINSARTDASELSIKSKNRESVFIVDAPGEYEMGQIMVRRGAKSQAYIIDEGSVRVAFIGAVGKDISADEFKNLGDIDVLIVPVGSGEKYPSYDQIEAIIGKADPAVLILGGYDSEAELEKFIAHFGYKNVRKEKNFAVDSRKTDENRVMEVIVLE